MAERRILIAKAGLDGHDRGAKYIVHLLRDAGYDVIYTGIRRSPEQIVAMAIENNVDAIGVSMLSGAHKVLLERVIELLKQKGAGEILLVAGGTIHDSDVPYLKQIGVKAIFTPGTSSASILSAFEQLFIDREASALMTAGASEHDRSGSGA